jgi:mRNA interferase RelE/StbE
MPSHHVELLPRAARDLEDTPRPIQIRLIRAIDALADAPRPPGCKKLVGDENLWRIRVGDYRVLYEIHDDRLLVLVVRVAHRKDVYRRK